MEPSFFSFVLGLALICLLIAAPRRRQVWLCTLAAAHLFPGVAWAQSVPIDDSLTRLLVFMNAILVVLSVIATVIWLVKASRPTPPLHRQFAELRHNHPDYVTRPELSEAAEKISREVDRKLEESARRDERFDTKLDAISSKLSDGFSHVHRRIDPMAETLAATAKALEHHLDNHRKGVRNGN